MFNLFTHIAFFNSSNMSSGKTEMTREEYDQFLV